MSEVQKKLRERATRLKRALANEQRKFGDINDGAGKRYLVGPLYVLGGELQTALDFYAWYEKEFFDDIGEPIHYLFWALALFKAGNMEKANAKLLETMLQNVYLLPTLLGSRPALYDIWHRSNLQHADYLDQVPQEFVPQLTVEEHLWIEEQLASSRFQRVLEQYLSTYRALQSEGNIEMRRILLRRWNEFLASATTAGR